MSLKAVIFDMDGVLADTIEYHYLAWKKVLADYGIPFTRKDNQRLLGLTREKSLEVIFGDRNLPESHRQTILERKSLYFSEFLNRMSERDLLPGVRRLLVELKQAGLKVGVASGSRNAQVVLTKLGVLEWIDAIADGNLIQCSKPEPDSYLAAAQAIGVSPQDCLAIEDSPAGICAALSAGMSVIGLGPAELVRDADAVFPDLRTIDVNDLRQIHRQCGLKETGGQALVSDTRN